MPRLCVRGARGRFGGFGPVPGVVSLSFPPPRPACSALRVAGRPVPVSLTLARWYAIPRGLCVPRARSGCPSGSPRVSLSCVCARALAVSAPPPPLGGVACASCVVPALGAGSAVPRGPCPSACPAPVPCSVWRAWGGAVRSRFPPTWLGVVGVAAGRPRGGCLLPLRGASGVLRSPSPDCPSTGRVVGVRNPGVVGAGVRVWGPCSVPVGAARRGAGPWRSYAGGWAGGGGACAVPPGCPAGAGPVGRGVALPHPVPLPSLGRQQSGRHWRCAVHAGRGPPYHSGSCRPWLLCVRSVRRPGAQAWARLFFAAAMGAGGWGGGAGRTPAPLSGGGGPSPLPWGVGAGAPAAGGPMGGRGGGCRAAASLLSFRAAACGTPSWPSPCCRRVPFRRARAVGA